MLFISIDDLNDWVGVLGGHPQAKTPNVDRLARRGLLFTRAYCAATLCNPSRVALLTGLRPTTTGIHMNTQSFRALLPDVVTLPQAFGAAGYEVLGAGKIFHNRMPDPASWETYFPSKERQFPEHKRPRRRRAGGLASTGEFDWFNLSISDAETSDGRVVEWVTSQLKTEHERPFFLACGIYRPHLPWYVPAAYFDAIPLGETALPETLGEDLEDLPAPAVALIQGTGFHSRIKKSGKWKNAVRAYLASIAFADAMLGNVLDALDASAYADNTVVVMWSDHGYHLGEKEYWGKHTLWEESVRTPLIIAAPGITEPGTVCGRTVSLLDLYPTLMDTAGLTVSTELEGRSLMPLLENPEAEWRRPVLTSKRYSHSVRSERWRYIRYRNGSEELYDHDVDPNEWNNVALVAEFAAVKTELASWIP